MTIDFENIEPFEASPGQILPAGDWVGKVTQADDGESSGGHAQIELKLENDDGQSRDWLVISDAEFSQRKVAGLFVAVTGENPKNEWFDADNHCKQEVLDRLILGKKVGWIVRDEDDWKDATKTRPRVQGYCRPERIPNPGPLGSASGPSTSSSSDFGTDLPIDTAGLDESTGPKTFAGIGKSTQRSDEPDIPW